MTIRLSFGTAGIRARLGEGDDELNLRTVRAVGHALCEYVGSRANGEKQRGICVGFDGRTASREFAAELASVALAHGFLVRLFDDLVATPLLAFATQHHRASLGLMVTASHNPPSDNGIKVYWQGGAQILPPHDAEIARRIAAISEDTYIPRAELAQARARGDLRPLGEPELEAYLDAIVGLLPEQAGRSGRFPAVAYSALCGVGSAFTRALCARTGVTLTHVASQDLPRADFGGLSSPNPEHPAALAALFELTRHIEAPLAFCHDPDADRLAVIARDPLHTLRALTGDEVGALLTDFMLSCEPTPSEVCVVSTLVSGGLAERIARARGAHFERTLTGFKWITERGRALERSGLRFLFGYEEALGYCFGALGDDKDGIAALHVLLQFARRLEASGEGGLGERLAQLSREHGLFRGRQITLSAAGEEGRAWMARILGALRTRAPDAWLSPGAVREDYLERPERADLLIFRTPSGARLCVRPSGTEAKLKFYLEAVEPVGGADPLQAAYTRAEATLDDLAARVHTLADGLARGGA